MHQTACIRRHFIECPHEQPNYLHKVPHCLTILRSQHLIREGKRIKIQETMTMTKSFRRKKIELELILNFHKNNLCPYLIENEVKCFLFISCRHRIQHHHCNFIAAHARVSLLGIYSSPHGIANGTLQARYYLWATL